MNPKHYFPVLLDLHPHIGNMTPKKEEEGKRKSKNKTKRNKNKSNLCCPYNQWSMVKIPWPVL